MARADLLIQLIQSGMRGDRALFRKVVEAMISEERAKQHHVIAGRMEELLQIQPPPEKSDKSAANGFSLGDYRIGNYLHEIFPKKKLSDLLLPDDVVNILLRFIAEHQRADLLRAYNLEPRNRLLFIGPPGNGKSSLAEALAETLMIPLFIVRYENVVGACLGETAGRIRKIMEFVSTRHCILFFDEFETLGKERGDIHETGEIKRVVSSLLMQMDNLPSYVIIVGATNHAELLDRAVWRRFQIRIDLPAPSRKQIADWFKRFQEKMEINFLHSPEKLAGKLAGSSFAEVEEFGFSVMRQYVLEQPGSDLKSLVLKTLNLWASGSVKKQSNVVKGVKEDGISAYNSS